MLHVALIGARSFGQHHLEGMQRSPHVEAVTVAGRNREAMEALRVRFPKIRSISTDFAELFDDPSIDLIDVVLPHDMHLPVARAAFQAGKHVLMEKPPARTPAEFAAMREAAREADRRLFVVMNLLFSPVHHTIRAAVDAGAIGRPILALEVNTGNARKVYSDPNNWRADRERCGGGLLIDGGFHSVYRQLYYLEGIGMPQHVTADSGQIGIDAPEKGEDFMALTLAYATARAHIMSQWTMSVSLGRFPTGIVGTEGSVVYAAGETNPVLLRRPDREDEPLPVPAGPQGFSETVSVCVEHYLECLATGSQPWVDLDLAGLTLEVITSAYQSAAEGRRVSLAGEFSTRLPAPHF